MEEGKEGQGSGGSWELIAGQESLSLPDTLPHCVQGGLFLAHIVPELLYK